MIRIEHEIVVDRPAEDVFRYLADPVNDPEWCPPVLEVEQIAGSGPAEGAAYRFRSKPGPKAVEGRLTIAEFHPDKRAEYTGENAILRFRYVYRFTSEASTTRVHFTSELSMKGIWKVLTPIIAAATRRVTAAEFKNAKEILEGRRPRDTRTA